MIFLLPCSFQTGIAFFQIKRCFLSIDKNTVGRTPPGNTGCYRISAACPYLQIDPAIIRVIRPLSQTDFLSGQADLCLSIHITMGIYCISRHGIHIVTDRTHRAYQIGRTAGTFENLLPFIRRQQRQGMNAGKKIVHAGAALQGIVIIKRPSVHGQPCQSAVIHLPFHHIHILSVRLYPKHPF